MKLKLIALALLASTSIASAADLGARTYTKAPALAPVTNWSGFYVGVMGGYGWSDQVSAAGITTSSSDLKGGFGGGTIGYNWQVGPSWLFGLEVDAAGADISFPITTASAPVAATRSTRSAASPAVSATPSIARCSTSRAAMPGRTTNCRSPMAA